KYSPPINPAILELGSNLSGSCRRLRTAAPLMLVYPQISVRKPKSLGRWRSAAYNIAATKPTVVIYTNDQQMVAALVGAHSLKSRSNSPHLFDVRLLRLEETPHCTSDTIRHSSGGTAARR